MTKQLNNIIYLLTRSIDDSKFKQAYQSLFHNNKIDLEMSDIKSNTLNFLYDLIPTLTQKNFDDFMKTLEKHSEIEIATIEKCYEIRKRLITQDDIIFMSINLLAIFGSYIISMINIQRTELIITLTLMLLLSASLLLDQKQAFRTGVVVTLSNFTFIFSIRTIIVDYSYQLMGFLILIFFIMGMSVALLTPYIIQLFKKRFKTDWSQFLAILVSSFIYISLFTFSYYYLAKQVKFYYEFNPLYKILQIISISYISNEIIKFFLTNIRKNL